MRIVAGQYRSRVLKTLPGENTRPTTDKIKEAVFSRIGPYFAGGMMLDVFSGSGAIGLEALSRGFDKAILADSSKDAIGVIKSNVEMLKCQNQVEIWPFDYKKTLRNAQDKGYHFDLIYLDPPYCLQLINQLIHLIDSADLLSDDGIIVAESSLDEQIEVELPFVIDKQVSYGTIKVTYFRKEKKL